MGKNENSSLVILTGGGTGGHIYPAVSIGRAIQEKYPQFSIGYFGTPKGLEAKLIPEENWPFFPIAAAGLERKFSYKTIKSLGITTKGYFQARKQLKKLRPKIVIGTGGYVCGPVVLAAAHLGIPTIVHEQNAYPGLTNRLLAQVADQVMISFSQSKNYFSVKAKILHTGLPIREKIIKTSREDGLKGLGLQDGFWILVVGGSQGAKNINDSMLKVYTLVKDDKRFNWLHVVGQNNYENYLRELEEAGIDLASYGNIRIEPYIFHMENALAAANLVIGRAGASFLAEITAKGLPSILIPYPFAAENHQVYNAKALETEGATIVIKDHMLTGEKLYEKIIELYSQPSKLKKMEQSAKKLGKPTALDTILKEISRLMD